MSQFNRPRTSKLASSAKAKPRCRGRPGSQLRRQIGQRRGEGQPYLGEILNDLFNDDDLLPRLRRLFWLEATKAERDFNTHIVKPMLKQHDRNLQKPELRAAMEMDLENRVRLEELMRVWDGLHKLETGLAM
jgi:hypothetical protein